MFFRFLLSFGLLAHCGTSYTAPDIPCRTKRITGTRVRAAGEQSVVENVILPTYSDVVEASEILEGHANPTPIETSRLLDEELGISVFIKPENKQRTGSFKFRGAFNALHHISTSSSSKQVLTVSSGNHGQAVALSAKILGMNATIIMPLDAPQTKIDSTKAYGGNIVFYDRFKQDRAALGREYQTKTGATFVPPYDHRHVIAGQGTTGKELFEELGHQGLDFLFVCVGGGGLISGVALAAAELCPTCKVIGVEPAAGNDAQRSLSEGRIVQIETPKTIADGAQTTFIGDLTFEIMKRELHSIITVADEELVDTMRFYGARMKMVVEPTGCLSLAGLRKMVQDGSIPKGSKCGVVVTGGNVDLARYCQLLSNP